MSETAALLCETVTGSTMAELRAARDAVRDADMVELRLDGVSDVDVVGALAGRTLPVIITCRPPWEGGAFGGSEEDRGRILGQALELGADYVDVEWRAPISATLLGSTGGARIILSSHDFDGMPADLVGRSRAMRRTGADVVKIAVSVSRVSDCLTLLDISREGRTVAIGMGPAGFATRVLAARFGSEWSYSGQRVAPGQIPAKEMLSRYRFRQIRKGTDIYAVVGRPVLHSLSPAMHNAAFEAAGVDAVYLPLEAADFQDFLTFSERLALKGASVTIPFKLDALAHADRIEDAAERIGAVNTLRRSADGWEGTNTDMAGFLAPLADRIPSLTGARVSVLGAGGAARAVVAGLVAKGARVMVHARAEARARDLESLGSRTGPWPPQPGSWDVLVNCTPLGGMTCPDDSPLTSGPFDGRLVYDLIYTPAETKLLREAKAAGCDVLGGLPMLVAQAERQFEWWTNGQPPAGVMARAADAALGDGRTCD